MELPKIEPSIVKIKHRNIELSFQKLRVGALETVTEMMGKTKESEIIPVLLKVLAEQMYGYDASIEERLEYLKNLDVDDIDQLKTLLYEWLAKLGFHSQGQKESKKKSVPSKRPRS